MVDGVIGAVGAHGLECGLPLIYHYWRGIFRKGDVIIGRHQHIFRYHLAIAVVQTSQDIREGNGRADEGIDFLLKQHFGHYVRIGIGDQVGKAEITQVLIREL